MSGLRSITYQHFGETDSEMAAILASTGRTQALALQTFSRRPSTPRDAVIISAYFPLTYPSRRLNPRALSDVRNQKLASAGELLFMLHSFFIPAGVDEELALPCNLAMFSTQSDHTIPS